MNAIQSEIHAYYKAMYHETLVLYRLPGKFAVLGEDVKAASKIINSITVSETGVGFMPDDLSIVSKLGELTSGVCIIAYRNEEKKYDWPDIKRIKLEKELDSEIF